MGERLLVNTFLTEEASPLADWGTSPISLEEHYIVFVGYLGHEVVGQVVLLFLLSTLI